MRRCSMMASRSGVRTGILFAATTPAAWESERAFTASGSPANAALRTRRAVALPDAHPTGRLFTAQEMAGRLTLFLERRSLAPSNANIDAAFTSARLTAMDNCFPLRSVLLSAGLSLDRTLDVSAGFASHFNGKRESYNRLPIQHETLALIRAQSLPARSVVNVNRSAIIPAWTNVNRSSRACPALPGLWTLRTTPRDGLACLHAAERPRRTEASVAAWHIAAIARQCVAAHSEIAGTATWTRLAAHFDTNAGRRRALATISEYVRGFLHAGSPVTLECRIRLEAVASTSFDHWPRSYAEALSAVHHHDVRIAARLASPYAAHRAMIGFTLPHPYDWRRTRTRQLRAEPFALLNARRSDGVPSRHEWLATRDRKTLHSLSAIAPKQTAQTFPGAWNGLALHSMTTRAIFDLLPLRIEAEMPAEWTFRALRAATHPAAFIVETPARIVTVLSASGIRRDQASTLPAAMDVYAREWKEARSGVFRFDMRPIMARMNPSFSTVEINRRAQEWPAGRWNVRTASITSMAGLWNDPLPIRAIAGARWDQRIDKRGRLVSMHEVALREYVRDVTAFAAAWLGNRTPNGQNRYATIDGQRLYGFFGRFHVAYGARRDQLRDLQFRRTAHGWTLRINATERLTGVSWNGWQTFTNKAPTFRFDQSGGPPPPTRTAATWDWRPFGATRDGLAAGWHTLAESGIRLIARDVITGIEHPLGFLSEDDLAAGRNEIGDATLPDGDYEIEARPSAWFWPDARPATVTVYRLRADADPVRELPEVTNLHAGLSRDYWRALSWSIAGNADATDFAFGVWLNESEPPDLAANPDITIPRRPGLDYYEHLFRQTAPLHVAVAAFTPNGARGRPARLFLDWNIDAAHAPRPPMGRRKNMSANRSATACPAPRALARRRGVFLPSSRKKFLPARKNNSPIRVLQSFPVTTPSQNAGYTTGGITLKIHKNKLRTRP